MDRSTGKLARYNSSNRLSLLSLAAADIGKVVSMVSRKDSPILLGKAIFNLAAALFSTARREDLRLANAHLSDARRQFKGVREGSPERAKLDWLTAMIRYELGSIKAHRVWEYLSRAREDFLKADMPNEAVAVTSDLARISFPNRDKIRDLMSSIESRISRTSLGFQQKIRDVIAAANIKDWDAPKVLRSTIVELRDVCGPKVLPCLISWPPMDG